MSRVCRTQEQAKHMGVEDKQVTSDCRLVGEDSSICSAWITKQVSFNYKWVLTGDGTKGIRDTSAQCLPELYLPPQHGP